MTSKPPAKKADLIRPEDVVYGPDFDKRLRAFLDQFEPEHINQRMRDVFSNELAFLDTPEAVDFIDDVVVERSGSGEDHLSPADAFRMLVEETYGIKIEEQRRTGTEKKS